MQKLNEIQSYRCIPEGQAITFQHPEAQVMEARLIKMRINAPQATNLYLTLLDEIDPVTGEVVQDKLRFLAHIDPGYEHLEFWYRGSFALNAVGGDIWLDTFDSTVFELQPLDLENYARVWEREERDPRILEAERLARHNAMLLQQQMAADRAALEEMMAEIRREKEALHVSTSPAPASGGTGSDPAQGASSAPASDPAAAAPAAAGTGGQSNGGT